MLNKYILQSVKDSLHKSTGHNKNNYCINVTNQYRTLIGNRKFKLSVKDNNNGLSSDTRNFIRREWKKAGFTSTQLKTVGIVKALQILKAVKA